VEASFGQPCLDLDLIVVRVQNILGWTATCPSGSIHYIPDLPDVERFHSDQNRLKGLLIEGQAEMINPSPFLRAV
jgi:hypothetical protein